MLRLSLAVAFAVAVVTACGGGDGQSIESAPERVAVGSAEPSKATDFTERDVEVLIEEAQEANRKYGLAAACLFQGDFTSGGWEISLVNDLTNALGLPTTMTAIGTVGLTADGNSYLSFYDSNYSGATATDLQKVETDSGICYSPLLP